MKKKRATVNIPINGNRLLGQLARAVYEHEEVMTLWEAANVMALKRLWMTDHGNEHIELVVKTALKIQRILKNRRIRMSIGDFGLAYEYSELVVVAAALLHDVGMSVHRDGHESYSLWLVERLAPELLGFLPVRERVIVKSEVLHAITSHRSDGRPLTVEAGIVRVADALDMSRRRIRAVGNDKLDIHNVSSLAIDEVEVRAGRDKPVLINIVMNHTAGLYQVDKLLKDELVGSGIGKYLEVKVYMDKGKGRKLFKGFVGK